MKTVCLRLKLTAESESLPDRGTKRGFLVPNGLALVREVRAWCIIS